MAQKKLLRVSQSALTGVLLRTGSKRLTTELTANILLEPESKMQK